MAEHYEPKPHHRKAIDFVKSQEAAGLLLDPGLGKTGVILRAFQDLYDADEIDVLFVIAPMHCVYNVWPAEVAKWGYDFSVGILHGKNKNEVLAEEHDIYVMNPEGLQWLAGAGYEELLEYRTMLVVDESTKFKDGSIRKKRFSVLRDILPLCDRRVILTGTPMPNSYLDLFGQIYILDGGAALGQYKSHYQRRWFHQPAFAWEILPGAADEIEEAIAPLVLRMSAEDYLELPDQIDVDIPLRFTDNERKEYRELEEKFFVELAEGDVRADSAGVLSMKLRQYCQGAVYNRTGDGWIEAHNGKLERLVDLIEEISQPTIVVYEFDHDYQRIRTKFKDAPTLSGLSGKKAQKLVADWNAGKVPVLCMHPASGGHGLNLQEGGNHMVFYGLSWNLEFIEQVRKRIHRPGQGKPCFYYRIFFEDTIESDVVLPALARKKKTEYNMMKALEAYREKRR